MKPLDLNINQAIPRLPKEEIKGFSVEDDCISCNFLYAVIALLIALRWFLVVIISEKNLNSISFSQEPKHHQTNNNAAKYNMYKYSHPS